MNSSLINMTVHVKALTAGSGVRGWRHAPGWSSSSSLAFSSKHSGIVRPRTARLGYWAECVILAFSITSIYNK